MLTVFVLLFPLQLIYAPPPPDHKHAFDYAQHVLIGTILSVEILSEPYVQITANTGSTVAGIALYEIQVEKYLKNYLDTNIVKVPGYYVNDEHFGGGFDLLYHVDEKVFLYIQTDIHNVLDGHDLIIRSYESRSLDRLDPICDESKTFYHKGECMEISDCPLNTTFFDGVCNLLESPSIEPTREESILFTLSIIINLCIAFSLPIIGIAYFLKKKKHRVKVLFTLIGIAIFAFLGLTMGVLRFGAEA